MAIMKLLNLFQNSRTSDVQSTVGFRFWQHKIWSLNNPTIFDNNKHEYQKPRCSEKK